MTERQNPPLTFKYKNWQGEVAIRHVVPIKLWYGQTKFHSQKQWLLKALDIDKKAERDFAIKDIIQFLNRK